MRPATRNRLIFAALAATLLATRLRHFNVLPDASWAVLFLGGFYLRTPIAFSALALESVAIDYITTQHLGISSYCLSPAYAMLLPAYGVLWLGGAWVQHLWRGDRPVSAIACAGVLVMSVSLSFLISNGSFYWLSGHVSSPNVAGWLANFRHWYPHFVLAPCEYIGLVALMDLSIRRSRGSWPRQAAR